MIDGLAAAHGEAIVCARREGPFQSFDDFARRTGFSSAVLAKLSRADALQSLQLHRRAALWQSLPRQRQLPLFDAAGSDDKEPTVELPVMPLYDEVAADYRSTSLSLRGHPLQFLRDQLQELGVTPAARLGDLAPDCRCKVAGLVLLRQRPATAKGVTFVTLEDETGVCNLVIWHTVWQRFRLAARRAAVMLAHGKLQRQNEVIHVVVDRIEDISTRLITVKSRSRDFH